MNDFPVPTVDSKFAPPYWDQVGAWFRRVGGEYLRSLDTHPDALDLADWMLEEARRREPRGMYPGTGALAAKGMPHTDLVNRAEECAAWLLNTYRPRHSFTSEQRLKGGQRSRKAAQKRKTMAAYLDLQEELEKTGEVISWVEMAERLHITPRYLRTLRAEHAAYLAEPTWDDLLAEADAPILETKRKRCVVPRRTPDILRRVVAEHPEWGLGQPIDLGHFLDGFPEIPPIQWELAA